MKISLISNTKIKICYKRMFQKLILGGCSFKNVLVRGIFCKRYSQHCHVSVNTKNVGLCLLFHTLVNFWIIRGWYIRKVRPEIRDFSSEPRRHETRDQSHRQGPGPKTRDHRPMQLVEPKTCDPKSETRDPRPETNIIGVTLHPRPLSCFFTINNLFHVGDK